VANVFWRIAGYAFKFQKSLKTEEEKAVIIMSHTDLQSYTPLTATPEYISIVDGKICMEFPPTNQDTFFFRLGVE